MFQVLATQGGKPRALAVAPSLPLPLTPENHHSSSRCPLTELPRETLDHNMEFKTRRVWHLRFPRFVCCAHVWGQELQQMEKQIETARARPSPCICFFPLNTPLCHRRAFKFILNYFATTAAVLFPGSCNSFGPRLSPMAEALSPFARHTLWFTHLCFDVWWADFVIISYSWTSSGRIKFTAVVVHGSLVITQSWQGKK